MPLSPTPSAVWYNGAPVQRLVFGGEVLYTSGVPDPTPPTVALSAQPLAAPTFPIVVSSDKRGLVDAAGRRFVGVADTPWNAISRMSRAEFTSYCQTRRQQGYTAIFISILDLNSRTRTQLHSGVTPFPLTSGVPNLMAPNAAYFDHAVWCIDEAARFGLLCITVPAWYGGWGDAWRGYVASSSTDATIGASYGSYLASRFGSKTNVWWMHGGDNAPDLAGNNVQGAPSNRRYDVTAATNAMANALKAGASVPQLATYHTYRTDQAWKYFGGEPWYDLHAAYASADTASMVAIEYARTEVKPVIMVEALYANRDTVSAATPHLTRKQLRAEAWQAHLAGAPVSANGNEFIWPIRDRYPGYQWDTPGGVISPTADDLTLLSRVFASLAGRELISDVATPLVNPGRGSGVSMAPALLSKDQRAAVLYIPDARTVTIDRSRLLGTIGGLWVHPETGATVKATVAATMTPPSGWPDAVLLLAST